MSPFRLPDWLAWLLIPLLSLPALWPFAVRGLPQSADGVLHLLRLVLLDQHLTAGLLYPRWTPELFLGYGYPVFSFYGPVTYYLAEFFHLAGLGHTVALMAAFAVCLPVAGWGMYLLAADTLTGVPPGSAAGARRDLHWPALLAAVAYIYTPYFLTNVFLRGALGEVGAQALLPWIIWSFGRLLLDPRPARYVLPAALSLGGLAATHNITLLWTPPLLLAYLAFLFWQERRRPDMVRRAGWVAAGGVAAMGVSAFFWLPLLLERHYLSAVAFDIAARYIHENVWDWTTWLDLHWPFEYTLNIPFQLGLVQVVLAAVGLLLLRRWTVPWIYWTGVAVVAGLGISRLALPLWLGSDILLIAQFPWRLMSVLALPLALMAGLIPQRLPAGWPRVAAALALIALVILGSRPLPGQLTRLVDVSTDLTAPNVNQFEADTNAFGTSSSSEFMPRWASDGVFAPAPPAQDAPMAPPAITLTRGGPLALQGEIRTETPLLLRLTNFYFPGWRATLDGAPVTIRPEPVRGLMAVEIPPGRHTLKIAWVGTRVQQVAGALSLAALLALFVHLLWLGRRRTARGLWGVSLIPLALFLFGLAATLLPAAALPLTPPATQPAAPERPLDLTLLGFRTQRAEATALHIYPYWWVGEPLPDVRMRWSLAPQGEGAAEVTAAEVTATEADAIFNTLDPRFWSAGALVDDAYRLALPPDLPAGDYALRLQLVTGPTPPPPVAVGTVSLDRRTAAQPAPSRPWPLHFGDGIRLDGYDLHVGRRAADADLVVVTPGETLRYTLYWRATDPLDENVHSFIHLLDHRQLPLLKQDQLPGPVISPPLLWDAFTPRPDVFWFDIPPGAESGLYYPTLGLYRYPAQTPLAVRSVDGDELGERTALPPVKVLNPPRLAPAEETACRGEICAPVRAMVGDWAEFHGYTLELPDTGLMPGAVMTATLYYRATATPLVDFTQFVQLYDPVLGMAAQFDAQPQGGGNPTSVWQPGEVVANPVRLTVDPEAAPGRYRLLAGFYDTQADFARVPLVDAAGAPLPDNALFLGELAVEQ